MPLIPRASFEIVTRRMDVDVDGAPNAYGPIGKPTLDNLRHAHSMGNKDAEIVGYLTEGGNLAVPVEQGPRDPYPGYYISQTAFTDPARRDERDVGRYVDATKINYVVLGDEARRRGAHIGDFVAVYSGRTGRSSFGIVGDAGNPSGDEGSLHLLQELGYAFHDGRRESVEHRGEVIIRFFPGSNPRHRFFRTQAALNTAATKLGLSRDFPSYRRPRRAKAASQQG